MNRKTYGAILGVMLILPVGFVASRMVFDGHGSDGSQVEAVSATGSVAVADQVRSAVTRALRVHQTIAIPPGAAAGRSPNAAQLDQTMADGAAAVQSIFGANVAKKELDALGRSVEMQRTGHFRVLGGGIDRLNFTSVSLDSTATMANVDASVDTWSTMSRMNPDGTWHTVQPKNTLLVKMTLSRDSSGAWIVQQFTWKFAPGSEP